MFQIATSDYTAKSLGVLYFFTGKPCAKGHLSFKRASDRGCKDCSKEKQAKRRLEGLVKPSKKGATPRNLEVAKDWKLRNRHKVRAQRARWRDENRTKVRQQNLQRKKYIKQATPLWLSDVDKKILELQYTLRDALTKIAGEQYTIDHIVPLRSKKVCGLHVPWNLRVIDGLTNSKKGNTFGTDSA